MANDKKISELPIAQTINATDKSLLISNNADYQFDFSTLLQFINTGLAAGANLSFGTTLPQNITGKNGDVFINTQAGTFAQKIAGVWTVVYTIAAGTSTDTTVLYGNTMPGSTTGNNGDTFINTVSGIFYKKNAGNWGQVFSMQTGPQGPQGTNGTNGTNGANGKTILNGTINPANNLGTDGDFYINTSSYYLFGPKTAGVWGAGISLIISGVQFEELDNKNTPNGYAGLDNAGKIAAAQLPSYVDDVLEFANLATLPTNGEAGKIYITIDNNNQYRWSGSTYIQIVGSPGTTDAVPEGTTNKYFTVSRVLNSILTGIGFGTSAAVSATDTILQALGKLQAQISSLFKIPTGGTGGQVLAKVDGADGNVHWVDAASSGALPNGGTTGQLLAKNSDVSGDAHWVDAAVGGGSGNIAPDSVIINNPKSADVGDIWFFGDSITDGSSASRGFSSNVAARLGATEHNKGTLGNKASDLILSSIPSKISSYKYIFFEYGTNEYLHGPTSSTDFRTTMAAIIDNTLSKGWLASDIILMSTFATSMNSGMDADMILRSYNAVLLDLSSTYGTRYVECYDNLINLGTWAYLNAGSDKIHPNQTQHDLIANFCIAQLETKFNAIDKLAVNGNAEVDTLAIKKYNAIALSKQKSVLVIDENGNVGTTDNLPDGITANKINLSGSLIQSGSHIPPGFVDGQDVALALLTKIYAAYDNNSIAYMQMDNFTNIIFSTSYGGSYIAFYVSGGSTGGHLLSLKIRPDGIVDMPNGLLPGKMTTANRTAISYPIEGLTVYDTDLHKTFTYDGTIWQPNW